MTNLKSVKAAARKKAVADLIYAHQDQFNKLFTDWMADAGYTGTTNTVTTWVVTDNKETTT